LEGGVWRAHLLALHHHLLLLRLLLLLLHHAHVLHLLHVHGSAATHSPGAHAAAAHRGVVPHPHTATKESRIVRLGFGTW
jgi:hypothetical protein